MKVSLEKAAELLLDGHVVATPTDTVFGLAACYDQQIAIDQIFEEKERPATKPLTVLVPSVAFALNWVAAKEQAAFLQLANKCWPGATTIVVELKEGVTSDAVRRGAKKTGLRIPDHKGLQALLKKTGPLVNPSANKSGELPATSIEQVEEIFGVQFPVFCPEPWEKGSGRASKVIEIIGDQVLVLRD